ncbi:MAG: hypothetical protein JJU36_10630, partial [Phycisphaeraceae bacterium]|nr:hypothetical protein [Phycisphaeraceae bacterium]
IMATKPYCAGGGYIDRMSNYCRDCRFNPARATGKDACPLTTLYWDFLRRHRARFADNPRMALQLRNLGKKDARAMNSIQSLADQIYASPP